MALSWAFAHTMLKGICSIGEIARRRRGNRGVYWLVRHGTDVPLRTMRVTIWYIVLALGMLLTSLGASGGDSVSIANVLAQPAAFHARSVLFSGTVRDLTILPKTDEDLRLNPDGGGHLGVPGRCYFVRPAYKFTLDDGTGTIIISVRPGGPCVPGEPPFLVPPPIMDGDSVQVNTVLQVNLTSELSLKRTIEALATRIVKFPH